MPRLRALVFVVVPLLLAMAPRSQAQEEEAPPSFPFERRVHTPPGAGGPRVVVTEFFTQGALDRDGSNLVVEELRQRPVPWRVLQVGPGDFCRVAFQPAPGVHEYRIAYGGKSRTRSPAWGNPPGLVMEVRHWHAADLGKLASLREAFARAEPIGADYVPSVYLRFNPINAAPAPFLSETRGTLLIDRPGNWRFFTSSQDASFLLIDGHEVVSAPGFHGPTGNTRFHGEIRLTQGSHAFEYVHAASGPDCCLVAAWQGPGSEKAEPIPAGAFGSNQVARLEAVELRHQGKRLPRDMAVDVAGEVSLNDDDPPLVRVRFRAVTAGASATRSRLHWDFGDGQTSTLPDPNHIYLHPGVYRVSLTAGGEAESLAVVNQVSVGRALAFEDPNRPPDQLPVYLAAIDKYDSAGLDPTGLLQLVRVFDHAGMPDRAAKAGRAGLAGRKNVEEKDALEAARKIGELLRDRLADPAAAASFWAEAAQAFKPPLWKAEAEVEAADLTLNELLDLAKARTLLDAATARPGVMTSPELASTLHRVWGDWHARKGDRAAAQSEYEKAMLSRSDSRTTAEQDAWRGAFSRSAEAYLRDNQLDQARDELRRWERTFPADKLQGYLSLLQARLLAARGRHAQAIARATDLVAASPDSPYADRALFLAADSAERSGNHLRARALLEGVVNDYPGSPLVAEAKKRLAAADGRPAR
ncbi:MAG: PKD domain-containing protein [Isosphaeraceae bacterium]